MVKCNAVRTAARLLLPLPALLFICLPLFAPSAPVAPPAGGLSLTLRNSPGAGFFDVPGKGRFRQLTDVRLEMRVHDLQAQLAERVHLWQSPGLKIYLRGSEICASQDVDKMPDFGNIVCADGSGSSDLLIRLTRHISRKRFYLEVWNTAGGGYVMGYCNSRQVLGCPIAALGTTPLSDGQGQIGDEPIQPRASLAWIKWHSTSLDPGSTPPRAQDAADLADWRMEGTLRDSGPHGIKIGMRARFVPSPSYPPVPQIRTGNAPFWSSAVALRAGFPATLDGSSSYAIIDGSQTLRFAWTQISGPTKLIWSGADSATPTVRGFIFGSYSVRLTVTDSTERTSSTDFALSAVATDSQDVVIQKDPWVNEILGPQLRFGAAPWPWFDERQQRLAGFFGGLLATEPGFSAYWEATPLEGQLNLTAGSALLTGQGTRFLKHLACNGSDDLVIRTRGGAGRTQVNIRSCDSDTQLTLARAWDGGPSESGLTYTLAKGPYQSWYALATSNNFYDSVMAHYAMYYRTGDVKYLEYARTLADRWWRLPSIDEGHNWMHGYALFPRTLSMTGLFLRGLDGRPEILDGMRGYFNGAAPLIISNTWPAEDIREHGYWQFFYALAARYDRDPAQRAKFASMVSQGMANKWKPVSSTWKIGQTPVTVWKPPLATGPGTVRVVHGDPAVTGTGTQWTAATCGPTQYIVFANDPSHSYRCQFESPERLRLSKPFQGPTAAQTAFQARNLAGVGVQPFMLGIAGQAMLATHAVTGDALALEQAIGAAHWLRLVGYRPSAQGLYYGRIFPMCEPPDAVVNCTDEGNGDGASRFFAGEIMGFLARVYLRTKDPLLKDLGDTLMAGNFGKPGYGGPRTERGWFNESLDEGNLVLSAKKAKDYGFWFGFGGASSWLAARLGGGAAPSYEEVPLEWSSKTGQRAHLTVTEPCGATRQQDCRAGEPCLLRLDQRQGAHWVRIERLDPAGNPIGAAEDRLVELKSSPN